MFSSPTRYALLSSAVSLSLSATSFASTLECANAQGTAKYSSYSPDGGAPRGNEINWIVDGQRYIEETTMEIVSPGGGGFSRPHREASSRLKNQVELAKIWESDYQLTVFAADATVIKFPIEALIFSGKVICEERRYVGAPRP